MSSLTQAPSAQVYPVFIRATPEQIWEAITNPDLTQRYFYGIRIEVADGMRRVSGPDKTPWGTDPVIECDPPHRLVHAWSSSYNPELADEPESRVTWEIEAVGDHYSRLTLTHDQLERSPKTAAEVEGVGWMMVLSGPKTLLETGQPLS
jgi:uncharacterized protein YndB with AHSA1/START domain